MSPCKELLYQLVFAQLLLGIEIIYFVSMLHIFYSFSTVYFHKQHVLCSSLLKEFFFQI